MQEPGRGFEKKLQHEREMLMSFETGFARIGLFLGFLANSYTLYGARYYPSMSGGNRLRAYL
jgi:hypothetical protein